MADVLIVGAGPAGSVAATVLARAGVTVQMVDRAAFPRHKLCGDTVNPGTLAVLRRLRMIGSIEAQGLPVDGMRLTGAGGVVIDGRYPDGFRGVAIGRAEFDWSLLQQALDAGASFEPEVAVRGAIVSEQSGRAVVQGVTAGASDRPRILGAAVTIAADGRRSTLAFGLRLARHPVQPRRWAIGAYFEQDGPPALHGEMHVRDGYYIGVAPVPGGLTNVCLVKPSAGGDCDLRDPSALLARTIAAEPALRDRFPARRMVRPPTMLGPLAVEVSGQSIDGLLLAGDAAGFIDPMTGDGLRFAVRGGELAAMAALDALEHGWAGVHDRLASARRHEFSAKWRFNRTLRAVVGSALGVRSGAFAARVAPGALRALIARAGDCDLAEATPHSEAAKAACPF